MTTKTFGAVLDHELKQYNQMAHEIQASTMELGLMELNKQALVRTIQGREARTQQFMAVIAQRLEIPQGQSWRIVNGQAVPVE